VTGIRRFVRVKTSLSREPNRDRKDIGEGDDRTRKTRLGVCCYAQKRIKKEHCKEEETTPGILGTGFSKHGLSRDKRTSTEKKIKVRRRDRREEFLLNAVKVGSSEKTRMGFKKGGVFSGETDPNRGMGNPHQTGPS